MQKLDDEIAGVSFLSNLFLKCLLWHFNLLFKFLLQIFLLCKCKKIIVVVFLFRLFTQILVLNSKHF